MDIDIDNADPAITHQRRAVSIVTYDNYQRPDDNTGVYAAQSVRTISLSKIFEGVANSPPNSGEAIGILRLIAPDDLPLVAGVISATQTPLSHVNLRTQQNNIANAYLRNVAQHPLVKICIGQPVRLLVRPFRSRSTETL